MNDNTPQPSNDTQIRFDSLPLGPCPECLEKMVDGRKYQAYVAPGGVRVLMAYCWHRQVGLLGIVQPGKPVRWKMDAPIDALNWDKSSKVRAAAIVGAIQELSEPGPVPSQAH